MKNPAIYIIELLHNPFFVVSKEFLTPLPFILSVGAQHRSRRIQHITLRLRSLRDLRSGRTAKGYARAPLANKPHGTLYTGVTSNLIQRVYQHKNGLTKGFTNRYGCKILVYCELFADMERAIMREKQLKGGSRQQKLQLIEFMNPHWCDLYESIL